MSTTCATSWARRVTSSGPCAAWGIASAMPDTAPGSTHPALAGAAAEANAHDARLLRRVRWRLALWSGGATLLVLLALGLAIWITVRDSLASGGIAEARARASAVAAYVEGGGPFA